MDFSSVSVVRPYEQIVKQIQHAIRDGQLPRGTKLPTERELAEQFGVSRSVVREAIKVLDTMGLVESRQGSGSFVRNSTIESISRAFVLSVSPDAESVEKLFEFRLALEVEAARLAAIIRSELHLKLMGETFGSVQHAADGMAWDAFEVADTQFHTVLAEASGNPYLQIAVATAREMHRDVVSLFAQHVGSMELALRHHRAILAAIQDQDPETASREMAQHIDYTSRIVQSEIDKATRRAR